ncbi:phosphoribosylglycinamide formyltransferase [Curtobacterium flaccumfaciens pv. flaccumfaciens]|uniref:Phosphoribosylglycinamide formyltransferase n=1 Tax=Curtobacterium flaccumfaciens pv. flaccumfaciens TaxID=138532 RepID=A0A9Q2W511_9MICO|nr:phosphoribosylglycinamide formyltransferase [Curtobacterium flaccumfaciens]MBT1541409.1 phosphoribosylglycinamide formyltransferase [Curtobacterium flaccumfaciens pv. flaccumfaciens]
MLELVVLISGTGSNLRALLEATFDAEYPARVVAIGADRDAEGLGLGEEFSIPTFTVPFTRYDSRAEWGQALAEQIRPWSPDLLVLSGLMRLLPPAVVSEFAPGIINTHPAYLPEFPGAHGVRDALAAGVTETGASVIAVDDGVDTGPILAQERIPVLPSDSESTLHDRIKPVERRLLIQTILDIANGTTELKGTPSA